MTTAERNDKIDHIIAYVLVVDIGEVLPTASLRDDLAADSMDMAQLVIDIEGQFDIDIRDYDADQIKTVADVHALVARKVVVQ